MLRRRALSLLNGISIGFGPVSMGADRVVWRRAVDRLADARNFARRKVIDDDDVVALERWREIGRDFRYARGAVGTCF
jgi:hypothetical protein